MNYKKYLILSASFLGVFFPLKSYASHGDTCVSQCYPLACQRNKALADDCVRWCWGVTGPYAADATRKYNECHPFSTLTPPPPPPPPPPHHGLVPPPPLVPAPHGGPVLGAPLAPLHAIPLTLPFTSSTNGAPGPLTAEGRDLDAFAALLTTGGGVPTVPIPVNWVPKGPTFAVGGGFTTLAVVKETNRLTACGYTQLEAYMIVDLMAANGINALQAVYSLINMNVHIKPPIVENHFPQRTEPRDNT